MFGFVVMLPVAMPASHIAAPKFKFQLGSWQQSPGDGHPGETADGGSNTRVLPAPVGDPEWAAGSSFALAQPWLLQAFEE